MKILGIETSCDDTAAAIIEAGGGFERPFFDILANISHSQINIHKKFGGIVPTLASRAHLQKIIPTIEKALEISRTDPKKIDLIAVTRGPGLLPSILIGLNTARGLSYKWRKPIVGVNHIEGHIYSNWLPPIREFPTSNFQFPKKFKIQNSKFKIKFPALILVVSGGHTELVLMKDHGKYEIIGHTLDDAAGECFDKTARLLKLGFPGGPAIAKEAEKFLISNVSNIKNSIKILNSKFKITLPRPMIKSKDYNFSFSGLKTAVLYLFNGLVKKYPIGNFRPQMAAETEQAIIDVLVSKTLKAAKNCRPKTVMIAGGVSANKKLRETLASELKPLGIPFISPDFPLSTDNAAMIAAAGYFNYLKKKPAKNDWKKMNANANLRL